MVSADDFTPFFGVVEDIYDPLKRGRLRVRVNAYHPQSQGLVPTDTLQWFFVISSNSAGFKGIGESPTGYVKGSVVFGYFVDKQYQNGIIVGSLNSTTEGVNDVNALARGEDHPVAQARESNRIKNIQGPLRSGGWDEPPYRNNAKYPHNHVFETPTRIVKEFDGTEGEERIHEFHPTGTYYEVDAQGNRVVKVVGDGYEIIAGDKYANIRGTCNLTVEGDVNWYVKGNWNCQIDGDKTEVVQGDSKEVYGSQATQIYGEHRTDADSSSYNANDYEVNSGSIKLNEE